MKLVLLLFVLNFILFGYAVRAFRWNPFKKSKPDLEKYDQERDFLPKTSFIWDAPDLGNAPEEQPEVTSKKQAVEAQQECLPFRTNFNNDQGRDSITSAVRNEYLGSIVTLCLLFPKTEQKHKEALFFNIYKNGKYNKVVHGPVFLADPLKYIAKDKRLFIMQSGINTGCGLDPERAATLYEWQTHMARALYDGGIYEQAIFINWGALACANYLCLLKHFVDSCGTILGKMIVKHLIPGKITFAVQSIAAHIAAFACNYVYHHYYGKTAKSPGYSQIDTYIAMDMAGPFIGDVPFHRKKPLNWMKKIDYTINPRMARVTISIRTNTFLGTQRDEGTDINIYVRGENDKLPGRNGVKHLYEHAFATFFVTAMTSQVSFLAIILNKADFQNIVDRKKKLKGRKANVFETNTMNIFRLTAAEVRELRDRKMRETGGTEIINIFYGNEIKKGNYLIVVGVCWSFGGIPIPGSPAEKAIEKSKNQILISKRHPVNVGSALSSAMFSSHAIPEHGDKFKSAVVSQSRRKSKDGDASMSGAAPATSAISGRK